ncbi:MAG TPA: tRNA (adenosine(37)-N6)-threonylcarbamoyltransferase complex transferase subunit TsaD [Edaphocola sp.]|nr:tRNA (adenosine(37)-N6)-threonylcarbamoyltransferase complex transferase subunit TsaD [Edaphocola sp.]
MNQDKGVCILAIESSCDETSAALLKDGKMLSNIIATQKVHEQYGGVVPELASRAHLQNIVPVVSEALKKAGLTQKDLDAVAFTQMPGLLGSLLVGASFAKGMAQALEIPLIGVHHMQAHILAHWIEEPKPEFPFLCLTVSGGHTQIVLVKAPLEMEILGETIDDAAGEAFDKAAKMLNLPYPGGPLIDKYAKEGNPLAYEFPIPNISGLDFSFSGIKTSILYFLQKRVKENPHFIEENISDICASVQYTIIKTLIKKFEKAIKQTGVKHIGIAGGVSANSGLRTALEALGKKMKVNSYIPKFEYCTDNAAMIAQTAYFKYLEKDFVDLKAVPSARAAMV